MRKSILAAAAALQLAGAGAALGQDFYKDRTITFVIGFSVANGYDIYSRIYARHLPKHLAGSPTVTPQNMPGAGSLAAINHLANVAARDGTVLGMVDQAAPLMQLLGEKGFKADVTKLNWIGRITDNSAVLYGWSAAPVKDIREIFEKELLVSTPGQNTRMLYTFLNRLLGSKMKLLTGYKGAGESRLAMERGEVHALTQPYSVLRAERPEWLRDGTVRMLLQVGVDPYEPLKGVPLITDLARNEEEKRLIFLMASNSRIGRAITSPPGQPPERVAELRAAFMKVMADPEFLAETGKLQLDVNPMDGAALQNAVANSIDAPPATVEKLKSLAAIGG